MDLIRNFSREIRNPINSILGLNEMILRESSESQVLEYSKGIARSGRYLQSLLADIIDFAYIDQGDDQFNEVDYKMSGFATGLYNKFSYEASEKGLKFNMTVQEDLPEDLIGDKAKFKRIISNLIINSIRFTEIGSITVEIYGDDEISLTAPYTIKVKITDTGIGILPEEIDEIYRVDLDDDEDSSKMEARLGLAVAKKMTEYMNGKITLVSTGAYGSVFEVEIPQAVSSFNTVGSLKELLGEEDKKNVKREFTAPNASVLVVDDTKSNLKVMELLLRRTKVKVTTASDGPSALEILKENQFDMVFLDIMMPHMGGPEVLRNINEIIPDRAFPVIALTADVDSASMDQYLSLGFDDYMAKPVSGKTLEQIFIKWFPSDKIQY